MANLKMVKGKTYSCPPVFGDKIITKGDVVAVDDEKVAEMLLADTYFDPSNNEHHYFEETDEEPRAGVPEIVSPTREKSTPASAAAKKARTRAAAPAAE